MTEPGQYLGTDDRGMPVYAGGGGSSRLTTAFERMFASLSEQSRGTVARRTGSPLGTAVQEGLRRTATSTGLRREPTVWGGAAGQAGNSLPGVYEAGQAVGRDAVYKETHPYIGDYKGPDAIQPGNMHALNPFTGYRANDQYNILRKMSTETLVRLQDRLTRLGLADGMVPGQLDDETVAAFENVLAVANREGKAWDLVLFDIERAVEAGTYDPKANGRGSSRAPFTAPAYLAPDYATLAQGVKDQMRQALGRDPDDDEIAQLTAELDGWYRQSYDEEVEAARREYEMAEEGGTPEAGRSVDPASRFKESFESKFAGEIAFREQKDEVEGQQELVQGAVSAVSQMAGGMG